MNEAETEVMWAWHDTVHEGPYRFCQEQPCLSLRKLYPKGDLPAEYDNEEGRTTSGDRIR